MPLSLRSIGRWVAAFTSSALQVKPPNGLVLKDKYDLTDHSWMTGWRYEGTAYTGDSASAVATTFPERSIS